MVAPAPFGFFAGAAVFVAGAAAFVAGAVLEVVAVVFVAARLVAGFLARSLVVAFPAPRGSFGIPPSLEPPSAGFAVSPGRMRVWAPCELYYPGDCPLP